MAGWQHQCNGHELGKISGDGEGQGGLVWCSPWGCKESDTTEQLDNSNDNNHTGSCRRKIQTQVEKNHKTAATTNAF